MKVRVNLPGFVPWLVLVFSLCATLVSWHNIRGDEFEKAEVRFDAEIIEHISAIQNRMKAYEQMLRAGVAFINSSNNVDRGEWKIFAESLQVQKQFPGTLGYAYSIFVPHEKVKAHEEQMREEGFSNYRIHPIDENLTPSAIIFLEPLNDRNVAAIGYNMFKEEMRRTAMTRALQTGNAALAGRVILVQENSGPVQAGTLMYLPVYQKGMPLKTIKNRQMAIIGFVYAPLRMNDLMDGILGDRAHCVDLRIFDGKSTEENSLMFSSNNTLVHAEGVEFQHTEVIEIAGRKWTLEFKGTSVFNATIDTSKPWLIAIGGIIVSFLLFGFVHGLARSQNRAVELAAQMTVEIRKLSLAVEQSPSVVIMTDFLGNITYTNPRFTELTGYDAKEVLGKNPRLLKSRHTESEEYDVLWNTILAGEIWRGEMLNRKKNGDSYWALVAIAPIRDVSGEITGFVALQEDVTSRKEAEKAMIAAKEVAEKANVAKSDFLNTMSHELRTPLTVILGSTPFIVKLAHLSLVPGEKTLPSVRKLAEVLSPDPNNSIRIACLAVMKQLGERGVKMEKQGRHLLTLITDILDLSKIEAGKMVLEKQPLSMISIVAEMVSDMRVKAREKRIDLSHSGDDVIVNVDEVRLRQILINLIGNAIKFTDVGQVEVVVKLVNGHAEVRVKDSGCGIAADKIGMVFQKFTQVDSSATRKAGGTGLGLTITKRLVEIHGGQISMESEEGVGSTFIFTIPMNDS